MADTKNSIIRHACRLLKESGAQDTAGNPAVELLAGDGSQRTFYRLRFADGLRVVVIVPSGSREQTMAEAGSAWHIGRHLFARGVPVPEYYAFDRGTGLILAEDLGDTRLYEYAAGRQPDDEDLRSVFTVIIGELVRMQTRGHHEFQISWCWQTARYDRELMLERESGYFLASLCRDFLHINAGSPALQAEFEDIAARAAEAPAHFFLHRDFQSRNIMLQEGRVRFIDFQGGRLGPLGYDLASLVIDPYVGLPPALQEELVDEYIRVLNRSIPYDAARFRREYTYLALQRNLQILGAFAFLSRQRGKVFFRSFIRPALFSLQSMLAKPPLQKYSSLKQLTDTCLEQAPDHDI